MDVVLTAPLRATLFSLLQTQARIDQTQLRLATGREVNRALDDPVNFFSASALNNKAGDLSLLLDGVGQSIQTIKAAEQGLDGIDALLAQADAIFSRARDIIGSDDTENLISGDVNITQVADLTALDGIAAGDQLVLTYRGADELIYGPAQHTVTITAGMTSGELVEAINDLNNPLSETVFDAGLNSNGELEIGVVGERLMSVEFRTALGSQSANLALAAALGFGDQAIATDNPLIPNSVSVSSTYANELTSFRLYDNVTGETATANTRLSRLRGDGGFLLFTGLDNAAVDRFEIGINNGARAQLFVDDTTTIQQFIDDFNSSPELGGNLQASFLPETGQIQINITGPGVQSIQTALGSNAVILSYFGFNVTVPIGGIGGAPVDINTIQFGRPSELNQLQENLDSVLAQIDQLAFDSSYRSVNLLRDGTLSTYFNEKRTSFIDTVGDDFSTNGLNLTNLSLDTALDIELSIDEIKRAVDRIRSFSNTLASDLNVIASREDMLREHIRLHTDGADKLTLADVNAEGAKLLALETAQQFGLTSLQVATNANRSVLQLFL